MDGSKKNQASSSSSSLDYLFVPRASMSSSSLLDSIFPPPSSVGARKVNSATEVDKSKSQSNDEQRTKEISWSDEHHYRNHEMTHHDESCNLSSSIFYGGQRHHSRIIHDHADSPVSYLGPTEASNQDEIDNGAASRGNWWLGSLYY